MKVALTALAMLVAGCTFRIESVDVELEPLPDLQRQEVIDLTPGIDHEPAAVDGGAACDPAGADNHCSIDQRAVLSCRVDGSGFTATSCDYGCTTQGGVPHCALLEPSGAVQASDCESGAATPTITSNVLFNTDDGSISGGLTRPAGEGLKGGISVRLATQSSGAKVAIFGFAGLTVAQGVVVHARGSGAVAIVASGDVTIAGTLDLQDGCTATTLAAGAGLGGNGAGGGGTGGGAAGGTLIGGKSSGGGGGGHGDVGGGGGAAMVSGGAAGTLFGDLTIEPLLLEGGGGGGAGGAGGAGGNGGGAVQLAAGGTLTLKGTIHAGGCGGQAGGAAGSGGGGGAGGAILLEAGKVVLEAGSVLAANGGGGGAGGGGTAGANARAGSAVATGGTGGGAAGGSGGVTGSTAGKTASPGSKVAGGGGGAVGRIAIKTRDGSVQDQGAVWSPALTDVNAAGKAAAAVGMAVFQ